MGHRGLSAQRASDTEMYLPAFNPFLQVNIGLGNGLCRRAKSH